MLPQHAGQRPHLQVTATLATVQGREGAPAAELDLGGPIAAETARRLGCDAGVTRWCSGPTSGGPRRGPGDPGAGDGDPPGGPGPGPGCVWPGCHRPASWGEVHHLRHWAQGGSTDLANLVTICRAHHWKVHEGGWRLIRTDDGVVALPPVADDYAGPGSRPRPPQPAARYHHGPAHGALALAPLGGLSAPHARARVFYLHRTPTPITTHSLAAIRPSGPGAGCATTPTLTPTQASSRPSVQYSAR